MVTKYINVYDEPKPYEVPFDMACWSFKEEIKRQILSFTCFGSINYFGMKLGQTVKELLAEKNIDVAVEYYVHNLKMIKKSEQCDEFKPKFNGVMYTYTLLLKLEFENENDVKRAKLMIPKFQGILLNEPVALEFNPEVID